MSDLKCILYREKDGIGWITLNRPEVLNALNIDLLQEAENLVANHTGEFPRCRADDVGGDSPGAQSYPGGICAPRRRLLWTGGVNRRFQGGNAGVYREDQAALPGEVTFVSHPRYSFALSGSNLSESRTLWMNLKSSFLCSGVSSG